MKIEQMHWSGSAGWQPLETPTLAETAQIVFLFGSAAHLQASGAFALCRSRYPHAHVLGSSTAGEISGTDVRFDTVALIAVAFERTPVAVAQTTLRHPGESFAAGERLMRSLDPSGLRHVFVLSEVLEVDASALVAGLSAGRPAGVSVSGGFSADGDRQQISHVWCDGDPAQSAVAGIGLYGDHIRVGAAATGLWGQFGPLRRITRSSGSVLHELDGRSALAIYKEYLGELAAGLPTTAWLFPLALSVGNSGGAVLRGVLQLDEANETMRFAGAMPQGSTVRMMMGHIEALLDDTRTTARAARLGLEGMPPELSIVVSCNGRRHVLKQRLEEEIEAVCEEHGPGAVITGFYGCGEIAPVGAEGGPELHNQTMSITCLAEA